MKKYDYVKDLSARQYSRWEDRMIRWTMYTQQWGEIGLKYLRDSMRLHEWAMELHELTGLMDYE